MNICIRVAPSKGAAPQRTQVPENIVFERCCMCPNIGEPSRICPGLPGTPHPTRSACRFVREYVDKRGWKYKVGGGIGGIWKGKYQKPEKTGDEGWHGIAALPWEESFDAAQASLNRLALQKGWLETKHD